MTLNKPSVCFVAPALWPVFSGDKTLRSVGGAEVQQSILARSLAQGGHQVSVITMDYGQKDGVAIDGVHIYKAHTPDSGLPVIRFVHPRLTSIWRAMERADADIYYQRSCGMLTGVVAHFCNRHGRQMIYAAACDADFDPQLPFIRYARDRWLYRYGLRHANRIVVQNSFQKAACLSAYQRPSIYVPSCYQPPCSARANRRGYILWASTLRKLKRPELFIELARRMPEYRFRMVGGAALDEQHIYKAIKARAAQVANLDFVGFVPYANIEREFNGASIVINTSTHEGFPNTFLQAWARGIPTLSLLALGLTSEPCVGNISVANVQEMAEHTRRLIESAEHYRGCSRSCLDYFHAHHSLDAVTAVYSNLLVSMQHDNADRA